MAMSIVFLWRFLVTLSPCLFPHPFQAAESAVAGPEIPEMVVSENGDPFWGKHMEKPFFLLGWHYHYHYPIIIIILSLSLSYLLIQWIGLRDDLQETNGFYH